MSALTESKPATRTFWIVGIIALTWNIIGVITYLMTVTIGPDALADMPEAERALYTNIPTWVTSAYAIAVFSGLLGCVFLLMRKAWALPVFIISLAAILVQMAYTLFVSEVISVQGIGAIGLPIFVILVAAYLVWHTHSARQKGLVS